MQSKLFLTALVFSAASSVANAKNSTESAFVTVVPKLNSEEASLVGNTLADFAASHTTDAEFIAIDAFLSSAPTAYQSEFNSELVDFDEQLITTKSVAIPPFVTGLPSSVRGYILSFLEGESKIIVAADLITSTTVELRSDTVSTISTASSPSSTGTHTGVTSATSGTKSNSSGSGSGSSTTAAPPHAQSASSKTATSKTASSSSSRTGNAATQPTGALRAMGALAVGVVGLVVMA